MTAKPWLDHYDPGVPQTLEPYPQITLLDHARDTATQRPDHTALIFKGERISYGELEWRSDALAQALIANGVKKGDRVAIVMANTPQFVIAEFAIWKAGGIVASINPLYTGPELEHALNECGARDRHRPDAVLREDQGGTAEDAAEAGHRHQHPGVFAQGAYGRVHAAQGKEGRAPGQPARWRPVVCRPDPFRTRARGGPAVEVKPEDPALILFTGGTTGVSKAAFGTHQALVRPACRSAPGSQRTLVEWDDRFMGNLPLFHVFAAVGVQTVALLGRSAMVLIPNPRDLDDVVANIEKTKPTFLPGVPTLFIALLNHPKVKSKEVDMTSIKLCISGAAPLMLDTKQRFEALTGGRIVEGYALTESMMATVISPVKGAYKPGFVGMPVPDVEMRIVDADTGHERDAAAARSARSRCARRS